MSEECEDSEMMQKPIKKDGLEFWLVGCRYCDSIPQFWEVFFNLESGKFLAKCVNCSNTIEIKNTNVFDKPAPKAIPLRNLI